MKAVSFFARHEPSNFIHVTTLSFHGVWAIACWTVFVLQWILPKGTHNHKAMGRFIFWVFLFPLEVTGLLLVPYLFSNAPRANIVLTSGYLVIPGMGFHFLITTFLAFPFRFLQDKISLSLRFMKWFITLNFILQLIGSSALAYKIASHVEVGIYHENNIELFILTTPFTIMQCLLLLHPHPRSLGHTFYIKYLTLQMFPGTMIVIARDDYWLWGPGGLTNLYARIGLEFLPMVPFFIMVWPTFLGRSHKNLKVNIISATQKKNEDVAISVKSTATALKEREVSVSSRSTLGLPLRSI
ncbi:hypothetical protein TWF569_009021 [Orbilia oligospora]|uniref:Uncharacterized protein n=1 Tax=Orbilia oligospora TaxID=2813651 RepID=A0A7C8N9K4_ORBOL|nr:hypothetical protein TWF102_008404 [Orbilia oligospora]KAF3096321.1 hypothetical protein TWF103_009889 [Orbilia oligospora]KAF3124826.1 hypothetical protein TWF703_011185 [Orbilia oligospora]KAF3145462.1 hypothetical protein TWF594_004395 [Orbilia oligospora]KAF3155662.1 hypothetical protein TWF569_009021 [Orbilia oligospora]